MATAKKKPAAPAAKKTAAALAARAKPEPTLKDKAAARQAKTGGLASKLGAFEKASASKPGDGTRKDLGAKLAGKAAEAVAAAGKVGREKKVNPKLKAPKTLALAADELYQTRLARLAKEAEAKELQEKESFLKEHLIANLPKSDASGVAGRVARVTIGTKKTPRAADWSKVYASIVADYNAHVKKRTGQQDGAFSLLNKALGAAAIQERWDAGKTVPGVEAFNAPTVSINKI